MWLDAGDRDTLTVDDAGRVSAWRNKVDGSQQVVTAVGDQRPLWVADALGSRATVRFDGRDDVLKDTGFKQSVDEWTLLLVTVPRSNRGTGVPNGFHGFFSANSPGGQRREPLGFTGNTIYEKSQAPEQTTENASVIRSLAKMAKRKDSRKVRKQNRGQFEKPQMNGETLQAALSWIVNEGIFVFFDDAWQYQLVTCGSGRAGNRLGLVGEAKVDRRVR